MQNGARARRNKLRHHHPHNGTTTASCRREYHCHTLALRAVERARQDELVVLRFMTNYSPTLFYDLRLLVL